MKCPACSAALPDASTDCPGCGVNFENWKKRGRERLAPPPPADPAQGAQAPEKNRFAVTLPSGKLAAFVCLAGLLFFGGGSFKELFRSGLAGLAVPVGSWKPGGAPTLLRGAASPAPLPELRLDGFNAVLREYSMKASSFGVPLRVEEAKEYFQEGVDDARGLGGDFDLMAEAGIRAQEAPFTEEEKRLAVRDNVNARCSGPGGTEYLERLPTAGGAYGDCWLRTNGRAKGSDRSLVVYSPLFPGFTWAQARRLPGGRWEVFTPSQQADAACAFAEKYYGTDAIREELTESGKVVEEIMKAGLNRAPSFADPLLESYKVRFRREGVLAGADALRRR